MREGQPHVTQLQAQIKEREAVFEAVMSEAKARLGLPAEQHLNYDVSLKCFVAPGA